MGTNAVGEIKKWNEKRWILSKPVWTNKVLERLHAVLRGLAGPGRQEVTDQCQEERLGVPGEAEGVQRRGAGHHGRGADPGEPRRSDDNVTPSAEDIHPNGRGGQSAATFAHQDHTWRYCIHNSAEMIKVGELGVTMYGISIGAPTRPTIWGIFKDESFKVLLYMDTVKMKAKV